jgi:DNA-binding NarL/FixJ family response regulator
VPESSSPEGLSTAVRAALCRIGSDRGLTPHQQQLLILVASGMRYSEVARERGIKEQTVKEQARTILARLGLRSRAQVEGAAVAAERRALSGATAEELYVFLQIRFE